MEILKYPPKTVMLYWSQLIILRLTIIDVRKVRMGSFPKERRKGHNVAGYRLLFTCHRSFPLFHLLKPG